MGFKALLRPANFALGPDATHNTEIHTNSVHIKAPNSFNASKRKHKNQINHYDKQRRVRMAIHKPQIKERQNNQFFFPQQGDHNAKSS